MALHACFGLLLALFLVAPAQAEKRVALVIGNGAYKHAPALANPRNDAEAMAAALKRLKFEVLDGVDLDEAATKRLLREFAEKLEGLGKEDVAVFFYAGHGLQVSGRNYLVPIDAKLEKERDLDFQAVSFDFVQGLMEKTAQTNVVILDSCRDNPLARTLARGMGVRSGGIGRGLAEMRGINDTLIVYATNPGNVALDGAGRHSPFTTALLQHIEQPGLEVRHMISQVRAAVIASTKGQQVPWEAASLTRQVYFAAAPGARDTPPPVAPPPAADNEALFWQSIKDSKNAADFKDFLSRWPQGTFAELAKRRLAGIEKAAVTLPPPEKKPEPAQKPAAPQRTSSFLKGMSFHHSTSPIRGEFKTNTPELCRSACLAETRCVAWKHYTLNPMNDPGHLGCQLYSVTGPQYSNSLYTSGVVRTTLAAATPAQPGATPAPAKPAPGPRRSTFEPGIFLMIGDNNFIADRSGVPTAQGCQAICLAMTGCGGWIWVHDTEPLSADTGKMQMARRTCTLWKAQGARTRRPDPHRTSGEIR